MSLPDTYAAHDYWRRYLPFLPEVMRLPRDPEEEWWEWRGTNVHLDRLDAEDASLKVIVLHGGGGTGSLVSAFGALVLGLGYCYVAPDLPGFGLTVPGPNYDPHCRSWVALVADLVAREQARDGLPVVTFGGSLGGMLAYNAAAASGDVRGVIATTLADPRDADARDALARSKLWSRLGYVVMNALPALAGRLDIPARKISRMEWITNDPAFSRIFIEDPLVGEARINFEFYRSLMVYEPPIAPEAFDLCPLLLAHPADDRWTPLAVSRPFFDRLGGEKELVMLEGCGHFPYEEPGVSAARGARAIPGPRDALGARPGPDQVSRGVSARRALWSAPATGGPSERKAPATANHRQPALRGVLRAVWGLGLMRGGGVRAPSYSEDLCGSHECLQGRRLVLRVEVPR